MTDRRVIVTRRIPDPGMERLRRGGAEPVVVQPDDESPVARDDLVRAAATARVVLCLLTEEIDEAVLGAGPDLQGVANMAVGYDNVDVGAATRLGIPVANTPGVLTETTADMTWALLLAVARRIPEADAYARSGRYRIWGPRLLLGRDVGPGGSGSRKTLGIVGFGRIGQAVARRSRGFDMRVLAHDPRHRDRVTRAPSVEWAELDELLGESDFVSLHIPLTAETRHLIGEGELRTMKPSACLVNTSRGPVVDEGSLVRALEEGWIAGAALDVFEDEPGMAAGLTELTNVVLTPHIASGTLDTRGLMATMAAENALALIAGRRAPDCVNPEVYETDAFRRRVERR